MLTKAELQGEIEKIMGTLGTINFETSVVQTDMYKLLAKVVTEEIGDGGILRHRLMYHKHKLETALSHFNGAVSKFEIKKNESIEDEVRQRIAYRYEENEVVNV